MPTSKYIGRFAPTPSGPLHFGSVVAALGSFLQARQKQGQWLVRIEDIDHPRTIPGADRIILEQLETLGLHWDGEIVYQSQRHSLYQTALERLEALDLVFPCTCTRNEIANKPYPGTCRNRNTKHVGQSLRILTDNQELRFNDLLQGDYSQLLESDVGDFVIKRTDGLFAYHLVVVVDDAEQDITEIVRGADLLDSTPRQIYLQKQLDFPVPDYLHLPVALNKQGQKISKQTHAEAIELGNPCKVLFQALKFLGQCPPNESVNSNIESLLNWSIKHWDIAKIPKSIEINTAET